MGLGFTPERLSSHYDVMQAKYEQQAAWNLKRGAILKQLWLARDDSDEFDRVLEAVNGFNNSLTELTASLAISTKTIKRSFETRYRGLEARKAGRPVDKKFIPLYEEIQGVYPDSEIQIEGTR